MVEGERAYAALVPMTRYYTDCREMPSEKNCTVLIAADSKDEVLEAVVQHAVAVHGHPNNDETRKMLSGGIKTSNIESEMKH